ncbi:MAG: dUTP diphosphatase [Patescibacteria group bacterium]|nr:dUTP diphosphatase [Patescibacteria group bacterium]
MQLSITRIDKDLPMPKYETAGAVAFDVYARETTTIESEAIGYIPTNLIVCIPKGYCLLLASRSSTPKKGLMIPHGMGLIDQDYCGPEDEMLVMVHNFTDQAVTVKRGERIAQGMLIPIEIPELIETDVSTDKTRGHFGSTG